MFEDTQPAPLQMLSGDSLDEFRVTAPPEVLSLLHQLIDGNTLVHLSAPDGSTYTTSLWTVDGAQRKLSFSADAGHHQLNPLIDAGEATAVAYLDSVKLQFDVEDLMLVHAASACALQTRLPGSLFRFQRRDSFRVRAAGRTGAHVRLRHPSMPDMQLALRVLDVSTGGCALFLPDDVPPLSPGLRLHRVRLELDVDTRFEATLQLRHVTSVNPQSGGTRLGCSLADLNGDAQRALQRYIDQTQKRRRLLSLD
jgi:c-di-GMP-binding flagellar brake protein YcgR